MAGPLVHDYLDREDKQAQLEVYYRSSREYTRALAEFQVKYPKVSEDMMRMFWRSQEYKQGLLEFADRVQKPSF